MLRHLKNELFIIFLAVVALFAIIPLVTYAYFVKDLSSKESVMNRNDTGLVLLDRNNTPFFAFYEPKHKILVSLSQISPYVEKAVLAAEDKDFYTHPGFSIKAIVRSLFADFKAQRVAFGGSTITQQLVKNSLLTKNKSFLRKYQEIILAQEVERRFTKKEILEMYLNSAYFGEGAFGIEEAAQVYFGKSAKDLGIAESSLLAGILPAPSRLSPISGNLKDAQIRQQYVLQNMVDEKYITQAQRDAAQKVKFTFSSSMRTLNTIAPHFAIMVRDELIRKYGEEFVSRAGLRVKTTLDLTWQKYAEKTVAEQVKRLSVNKVTNGAAVALDPKTGEIKAMVGSKDWAEDTFGKVNIPITTRQPGSSFKPIVYAAALEKGAMTLATVLHDQPTKFSGNYSPQNYDRKFRGPLLPRRALANSLNVPSVEVLNKTGIPEALDMARRLGIGTLDDSYYGMSLVLGTAEVRLLDLTSVYGVFANGGVKNKPYAILEIKDKRNKKIFRSTHSPQRVLGEEYSFLISSILSDNKARAEVFGNTLTIARPAAVKTGTTENYKDAWTVGYTPSLAIGVWVGNNDGTPMDTIAGSLGAAPIWARLMEQYLVNTPIEKFTMPQGVVSTAVCMQNTPQAKSPSSAFVSEYFVKGTEPSGSCIVFPTFTPTPTGSPTSSGTPLPSPTVTVIPTPFVTLTPTPQSSNGLFKKKVNEKKQEINLDIIHQ